jgi:hypothetical protein
MERLRIGGVGCAHRFLHGRGDGGQSPPYDVVCFLVLALLTCGASAQLRPPIPQADSAELIGPGASFEGDVHDQQQPGRYDNEQPGRYDNEQPGRYAEPSSPPYDFWQPTWMPCQSLRTNRSLVLGHLWFGMDIMAWSTKGVHAPALLTTSPGGTDIDDAGVIGTGAARVLFGDEILHNETRPGGRLRIGWYFDPNQYNGLEWHYFDLDGQDIHFDAIAAGGGILARPIVDASSGDDDAVLVAFPGVVTGEISFLSHLQLTSTGIVYHDILWASQFAKVDYLVGYRHARLYESLRVDESLEFVSGNGGFVSGDEVTRRDQFRAINQFDGADFGLRGWWSRNGKLAMTGLAKIAVGASNKNLIVDGFTTIDPDDTVGRGVLALPSNRGGRAEQEFGVISEIGLGLEWLPVCQVRLSLGYTWFYWSDVARAFDQIDTTIATDQLAPTNGAGGRPAFDLQTTSFWAQGLNAGFTYEF